MKFNKIIFSAITLSALVFTGCNKGGTEHLWKDYKYVDINYHEKTCYLCKDHPEGHTETEYHHWDDGVLTTKPTHMHKGEITFTCTDCGGKRYREVDKLTEHVFDRCIVSDDTFKEDATCEHPAVYYKSCECGEISKTDTFYHGEKLDHDIDNLEVEGDLVKKEYAAYEEVDLTGLTVKYTCSECGEHTVDLDDIVVTYEGGTDSFRYINSATTQKVTLHFEGETVDVTGITVNKVNNEITGLEDMTIHCHDQLDLSNVKATYGEVKFTIKDKDDQEVQPALFGSLNHEASPYKITAKVEAGDQYGSAEVTKEIKVEHEFVYDEDTGTEVCKCGTPALDCYYYDTTKKAVTTSYITGAYADKFDDQTVIIDEATGQAPIWEGVEPTFDNYKNLLATFSDGTTCRFRGHAVKGFLTQASDWSQVCVQTTGTAVNGYYVIANDITGDINANNTVSETDIHITLDGAYHTITKITVTGCMFGGCQYHDAYTQVVIKNLDFNTLYMANGARLFGSAGVNATMSTSPYAKFYNVRMLDIDVAAAPQSVFCNNGSTNLYKFVNSYFNLSKKDGITFQGFPSQEQIWAMPAFTNTTCVINHTYAHNGINYDNKAAEYKYDEATGQFTSYVTGLTFVDSLA